MDTALFDKGFLHKLESLAFISRRLYRGQTRGAHASVRRGTSLDFADFRTYQPGDDFRTIDWGIYGRLDKLVVRLYAEEEDLTIHLLLDVSASMSYGSPPKIDYARRLAAALGYVGIGSLDRVGVTTFGAGLDSGRAEAKSASGSAKSASGSAKSASGSAKSASGSAKSASGGALAPRRGRAQLFHLLEYMSALKPAGRTDIARSLEEYARRSRSPGLAIVITDLLDDTESASGGAESASGGALDGYKRGLQALLFHDFEVVLVHVLDREEVSPGEQGALRLTDMETGQTLAVYVDRPMLAAYRQKLTGFFGEVESFCLKNRIEYLRAATIVPFEDVVLRYLRQGAHLHAR